MKRLPFKIVYVKVCELMDQGVMKFLEGATEQQLDEHTDMIIAYINSCGWEVDDYIEVMFLSNKN